MSQRALISVVILFCLKIASVNAQVPTLDPSQTVNTATGEMGFALPLDVVKGVGSGHDFPINLYYQAGIRTSQEASAVGLGFSYGAGSISRKVVLIPDDCPGSSALKYEPLDDRPFCTPTGWRAFWDVITKVISSALALGGDGIPWFAIKTFVEAGLMGVTQTVFATPDFSSGGSHTHGYDYQHGDMKGFFKGGSATDLPDVYLINTPYINGELVWVNYDNENGHFVLKQCAGSSVKNKSTVKIEYDDVNEIFTVVTSDGITLVFDKADKNNHEILIDSERDEDGVRCNFPFRIKQYRALPMQWHLTRVLFPDYKDGTGGTDNDPLNSLNSNTGNWICFNYNETLNASIKRGPEYWTIAGPYSRQGINFGKYSPNYDGVTRYYFAGVTTPNERAVFDYINDRKDGVWYETGNTNPVYQPRLTGIRILTKDSRQIREITFSSKYELRHGTEYSVVSSDNPDKASLTLKAISIVGENAVKLPPITFEYGYNPDAHTFETTMDNGFSINGERRDLWGYYNPNTSNNWNANGEQNGAIENTSGQVYAAAWALKRMKLPTGKTIQWEYEANRFNFANNIQMTNAAGDPQVKYGGGIRVRSIVVGDGIAKPKVTSFFYTQMLTPGDFEETASNSAGHATVLPGPYILKESQDKRPNATRGGLYTPAKVAYEQCIIAENYVCSTHTAPNGYSVYKFITSQDFPNLGPYGMVDYSWKRGMLDTVEVYNSSHKLLTRDVSEYEYYEQKHTLPLLPYNSFFAKTLLENTTGWVKLKKTEKTKNGVKASNHLLYANDLTVASADKINLPEKKVWVDDANESLQHMDDLIISNSESRVEVCKTNTLGDPSIDDIAIVRTDGARDNIKNTTIYLCLGIDVKEGYAWGNNSSQQWSHWFEFTPSESWRLPYQQSYYVIGAQFFKMDDDDDDDLVVVITNGDERSSPYRSLYIWVFHDIEIESGTLKFNDNRRLNEINASLAEASINKSIGGKPVGCVIENFHGDAEPDLLIINNSENITIYPGDLLAGGKRSISAIVDFEERHPDDYSYIPTTYQMNENDWVPFAGCNGFIKALDLSNNKFDLIISGPGLRTPAGYDVARPINYQIFKDVSLNDANHTITWSCENCTSNYELFTMQPYCRGQSEIHYNWEQFTFGGLIQDDMPDRLQFLFPEWSNNGSHFNIFSYHSIPFNGDYDGAPNRIITRNSNGTILMATRIPCYSQDAYKKMGHPDSVNNKHMLVQSCGSVTYSFSGSTSDSVLKGDLSGFANRVVAANAATWTNVESIWLPCANYAWKVPMDSSGLPVTSFTPFNYTSPAANGTTWKLTDSICKYTSFHLPKETATPTSSGGRLKSSIIYGHKGTITTGTVTNACFEE
ncbi:MAG: hypothetical protein JXB49_32320, partial [Bacteroidales bacterium]|nr:hypothetical protein [Bacteroidales bacterium]